MKQDWYYTKDRQTTLGPVLSSQLKELARSGVLMLTDRVRKDGMPKWVPAGKVQGLFEPATPPALAVQGSPDDPRETLTPSPVDPAATVSRTSRWWEKPVLVGVSLLFCFPAGLALIWTNRSWPVKTKGIWTGGWAGVMVLVLVAGGRGDKEQGKDPPAETARGGPSDGPVTRAVATVPEGEYQLTAAKGKAETRVKEEVRLNAKYKARSEGYSDERGKWVLHGRYTQQIKHNIYQTERDDPFHLHSEGFHEHGKEHGKWAVYQQEMNIEGNSGRYTGKIIPQVEAYYKHGKLHGHYVEWDRYGNKKLEGEYRDGRKEGRWTTWNRGVLVSEETYIGGDLIGPVTYYYAGKKQKEGTLAGGKKQRIWTEWDYSGDGRVVQVEGYDGGILHGKAVYYRKQSDKKHREGEYDHGKKVGLWVEWNPAGTKDKEETYQADVLDGRVVYYNPAWDGREWRTGEYKKGKMSGRWIEWRDRKELGDSHRDEYIEMEYENDRKVRSTVYVNGVKKAND